MEGALKIIELKAQNVMNLKAVEIRPSGDVVVLTGKNEAGKSAVMDSIFMALTGKSADEPIRKGQEKGEVTVDLGKFVVRKVWTRKNSRLEISTPDGKAKYQSPQTLLNEIIGKLSFDPMQFRGMDRSQQRELLVKAVGLDVSDIAKRKADAYDRRKAVNQEAKKIRGKLDAIGEPPPKTPKEEVSVRKLMSELDAMERARQIYSGYLESRRSLQESIEHKGKKISELTAELEGLKKQLGVLRQPPEITQEEIAKVRLEIETAEDINSRVREAEEYRKSKDEAESLEREVEKLTQEIEFCDREKVERIKACRFPVGGLSIDDEQVLFEDVPFSQQSSGRQIRISTGIAMALNPRLRVLMVRDGSLLDASGMEAIAELARSGGYQLWIEKVDESGKVGVFIEEGEVKAVDGIPSSKK